VSATIRFVGGVNRPKLVTLVDSAGGERRQLVKSGSDDLRQDAVMQQFFGLLNAFLRDSRPAAARALRINTYKVVPFSPTAGLLEWVDNTVPLSEYLVGGNVLTRSACGRHLGSAFVAATNAYVEAHRAHPRDLRRLRPAFDRVTALPPVLHHFFLEHFREPGAWFQARTAFARSVAVGSMAGHVIGLGDRHGGNILLDLASAEVVHIDLGIAFEQGRFLPTPELVPFRMTRNVVDGMGVTGVEGVARRCCEHALRVIRANRAPILTVLEVFLHDPLYKWALTATAANRRQLGADGGGGGGEGEAGGGAEEAGAAPAAAAGLAGNADAERTLLRIKQKIEGREGGESGARGVEGQVQFLLAEAQDPDNLCRMYVGWGAYL
jgi:ataxia telangiectasia mutated family protein